MDDNLWLMELESALLDDCTVNDIYSICNGKTIPETLRPDVWQVCLDVRHKSDQLVSFNEIFDLPFQRQLRGDCEAVVKRLGNDDEDKVSVVSDLESILTFYCKNRSLKYEQGNGWIELLLPLLSLKLRRSDTYNLFEAIRDAYIPKGCVKQGNVFHLFRLLILYHDPELCSMLDTKRITPDLYSQSWFQSLFGATCTLPVVLSMWDLYFQQADPYLVFYLSLIMLVNVRDKILAMKDESKEKIVEYLSNMPCALEPDDVVDFCSLAQYYAMKTPSSFKTDLLQTLFGAHVDSPLDPIVAQALCLPVSVYELVDNASMETPHPEAVRFFLVDCRPAEQYNVGHLSTAFHLDSNLMLQEPVAFATAVQGLLRAQRQSIEANSNAGGEHLCFMGSGRDEEDQYTHMVVASFLQKNTNYVSLLTGGYAAIHEYFGDHMIDCLEDHDVHRCLVCCGNSSHARNNNTAKNSSNTSAQTSSTSQTPQAKITADLFSKWGASLKSKSAEVKGKLFEYIVNPATSANSVNAPNVVEKHVSASEKNGRRYRNVAPVFSIDDESEEPAHSPTGEAESVPVDETDAKEIVQLQAFLKQPDVITSFRCQEVQLNGRMFDSHLIVTKTHLVVLRDLGKGQSQVIVRRHLSSIVKITAKRRHRDLITFKYGVPDGETLLITDMDRFLIPNASNATEIVSRHIVQQLENSKNA
ncbi:TBC1 domain family member 23 [Phlebotomus argentipes]|uniref:TBC1 domain family member 23 n=1 Tax=Phlebotomus argentipes TaxID=94469 RepID=UPI0028934F8E|nr:TBC1 domain family member 23 [Phlebotomus argentipes]